MNDRYRMRCIDTQVWDGGSIVSTTASCGWRGVRTAHVECECYDIWTLYCRPLTPGPGCPRGIDWACPRCGNTVTGKLIQPKEGKA